MVTIDANLLGGGLGTRFAETSQGLSSDLPKQFQLLGGVPVFIHCLQSYLDMGIFRQVVITSPRPYLQIAEGQIEKYLRNRNLTKITVIAGGARRQDSSRLALQALEEFQPSPTRVLIHDACRPYISDELATQIKLCLFDRAYGAWVPAIPVVDTLKRIKDHQVVETVDRSLVQRIQTPQIFEFSLIRSLMDRIKDLTELNFTDDASLCEYYGIPVGVFKGDVRNIKLTYDFELETLQGVLAEAKRVKVCAPESATTFIV